MIQKHYPAQFSPIGLELLTSSLRIYWPVIGQFPSQHNRLADELKHLYALDSDSAIILQRQGNLKLDRQVSEIDIINLQHNNGIHI